MNEPVFFDEQGDAWPPPLCAVARVKDYGGDPNSEYNGQLVLIADWDFPTKFFIAERTEGLGVGNPAGDLLCKEEELEPLNGYVIAVMAAIKADVIAAVQEAEAQCAP